MINKNQTLRIFSYLPNPRIWKATITARIVGLSIDLRGSTPKDLKNWLWDYDARLLSKNEQKSYSNILIQGKTGFSEKLFKSYKFMELHPFGTVPAAFGLEGAIGVFESNSIMRLVARLGKNKKKIYGNSIYEKSRIDSFLDASLIFSIASQKYLLSINQNKLTKDIRSEAKQAFYKYMLGIENALTNPEKPYIGGEHLTLADICFFCEYALFSRERIIPKFCVNKKWNSIIHKDSNDKFPAATNHFNHLRENSYFIPDSYEYIEKINSKLSEL